jgi:hypothetical protein
VPGHDTPIECQYQGFQRQQLGAESGDALARYFWEPGVLCIGDNFEQLLHTIASNRRDDPDLGKVRANRIDDGGLLADEEKPGAMKASTYRRLRSPLHNAHLSMPLEFQHLLQRIAGRRTPQTPGGRSVLHVGSFQIGRLDDPRGALTELIRRELTILD